MKKLLPFLIMFLIIFYGLPLFIKISFLSLGVLPVAVLLISMFYGIFNGFSLLLSFICAVLFIPSLFITSIASGVLGIVYVVVFFITSLLGNLLGLMFRKKR